MQVGARRSKISTTDDRPSTDFERIVFTQETPLSAFSSGTVTRLSTSSVERPGRLGLDLDERRGELGEDVERRVARGAVAGDREHDRSATSTAQPQVQRVDDDRLQHPSLTWRRTRCRTARPRPPSPPGSRRAGPRASTARPPVTWRTSTRAARVDVRLHHAVDPGAALHVVHAPRTRARPGPPRR